MLIVDFVEFVEISISLFIKCNLCNQYSLKWQNKIGKDIT